jgi:ubiquinone/menaquinone biosynthesis C-methylase UbiE
MTNAIAALIVLSLVVAIALVWRWASWPCPAWLVPLLENPYVEAVAGAKTILEKAGIRPGMRVLDAGCGPGRLTLPASMMVGPSGQIVAVDIQRRMLQMLKDRVEEKGLTNVELLLAGLGEGKPAPNQFDIALLVTALAHLSRAP